jgi:type IV pilus assembly protein PilV
MRTLLGSANTLRRRIEAAKCSRAYATGFSLIEVLVAILVFSFGVLGVVSLQAAALRYHQEAMHQTTGLQLARELAEMVRDNRAVGARTVDNPYVGSFVADAAGGLAPDLASYCLAAGSGCAEAESLASAHMTQWLEHVAHALPAARVVTCFDSAPYDANGLPRWACPNDPPQGAPLVIKMGWRRQALGRAPSGARVLEHATASGGSPVVVLALTL